MLKLTYTSSRRSPESPRYLIAKGRSEEAHAILAKYHANGDMQDELVLSEMAEISTALQIERENTFTYADFLKTKANRHRLFIAIWVGLIVQWVGNGVRQLLFWCRASLDGSGAQICTPSEFLPPFLRPDAVSLAPYLIFPTDHQLLLVPNPHECWH